MTHIGTQTIKTARLTLRRFTAEDARAMHDNWAGDPEVTRFLMWQPHADVDASRAIIDSWLKLYESDSYYHWAIVSDETGEPIGSIAAVRMNDDIDMIHIGYALGRAWWHRGIMSEALAAVMEFFFTRVGAGRVESRHDPDNPHSGGVMRKCGMVYEGTLRRGDRSNRGIVDACLYAILRDEWLAAHGK